MAHRIALAVVALVTVLLGAVAVPLGLITASQDRRDFAAETIAATAAVAGVAEEHLDDRSTGPALANAITELQRRGDRVAVYAAAGGRLAGARSVPGFPASQAGPIARGALPRGAHPGAAGWSLAEHGTVIVGHPSPDRMLVIAPIRRSTGAPMGVVALSRSAEPLDHRIAVLWAWLAAVSVAGLVAAALLASALARWVSRPLGSLDGAARRLGEGKLSARAPVTAGPPEVRRLAANFNHMAARLEALIEGHQAMMADVSHQLRTPLAALRLRLDVLAQESPGALSGELGGAQEEVRRLSRLVDGLLAVARAENQTSVPVPVRVDSVIEDRVLAWRPAADEKPISLAAPVLEPLTARLGDGQLEQILDNLLANALDAVPAGGRVRISATLAGSQARISVADDGPGMSAQQRRAAFRRYVTSSPGGTGLGLAIVHRLATSAGGSAELSETPGGGLTVTICLPAGARQHGQSPDGSWHSTHPARDLKQF